MARITYAFFGMTTDKKRTCRRHRFEDISFKSYIQVIYKKNLISSLTLKFGRAICKALAVICFVQGYIAENERISARK